MSRPCREAALLGGFAVVVFGRPTRRFIGFTVGLHGEAGESFHGSGPQLRDWRVDLPKISHLKCASPTRSCPASNANERLVAIHDPRNPHGNQGGQSGNSDFGVT